MRWHYWVSGFFLTLTVLVIGWLCFEMNILGSTNVIAAENTPVDNEQTSEYNAREQIIQQKERGLQDREVVLKEHASQYEKSLSELNKKFKAQETANKQKLEAKEAEYKQKLAQKDEEIKKLKNELAKVKDARAESFKAMYEKMDAKKAAKVLEEMDVNLANQILTGMKQDKAAEIMSKMTTATAKAITEKTLAKRQVATTKDSSKEEGQ